MENFQQHKIFEYESHVITTLNRQIEALAPLTFSYNNLLKYHSKITADLASLLQQHDYAFNSLKSNLNSLSTIAVRTEAERNNSCESLKKFQNQFAKVVLDTRNLAQKHETLNKKLQLQRSRTNQNLTYKVEVCQLRQNIQISIHSLQKLIQELLEEQKKIVFEQKKINDCIEIERQKKLNLLETTESVKSSIAKVNLRNDDMIDGNAKLSEQIRGKEQKCMQASNKNRELKQKIIQNKAQFDKLNNQINYKMTLIASENTANTEMSVQKQKIEAIVKTLQNEKSIIAKESESLMLQTVKMENSKQKNQKFKYYFETHLSQLKRTSELLMSQMKQYCRQDEEVQNLILRKMTSLEFFAKKLNQKYEFEQSNRIEAVLKQSLLFKEKTLNYDDLKISKNCLKILQQKLAKLDSKTSHDSKKQTKSSQKSWSKQNRH